MEEQVWTNSGRLHLNFFYTVITESRFLPENLILWGTRYKKSKIRKIEKLQILPQGTVINFGIDLLLLNFEPTCAHARWTHMQRFLSVTRPKSLENSYLSHYQRLGKAHVAVKVILL